jgi:hypothetical protein
MEALTLNDKATQILYQHPEPSGRRILCAVADWTVSGNSIKKSLSNEAMSYSAVLTAAVNYGVVEAQPYCHAVPPTEFPH